MSTLGERIRYVREEVLGLNQADFADKLGFSRVATISDYELDKRSPDIAVLRKIASIGGVTLEWIMTGSGRVSLYEPDAPALLGEGGGPAYTGGFAEVKVYDISSAGGLKDFPGDRAIDSAFIPRADYEKGPVAIRVRGESMSPSILDGATVGVCVRDRRLVSGGLYAIWLSFEGVTIKRVFVYPDRVVLKPDNPTFPETAVYNADLSEEFILGKVVWVYQRY